MMRKNYLPGTGTTRRRITPTEFAHLRRWTEEVKRSVKITNITEMTNINQQLEQNAELYVSNIISRVIAQLIGKYGDGFVTLQATEDGELKVQMAAGAAEIGSLAAGTALIGKVQVAGTSRTVLQAPISFAAAANNCVVSPVTGKKIKIVNIMFTVAGEVNLTLRSGTTGLSGVLDFGAADEPRGMVHHFGDFPLETAAGEGFCILASTIKQVSGYVTYFTE
jgi:hypothetical protein